MEGLPESHTAGKDGIRSHQQSHWYIVSPKLSLLPSYHINSFALLFIILPRSFYPSLSSPSLIPPLMLIWDFKSFLSCDQFLSMCVMSYTYIHPNILRVGNRTLAPSYISININLHDMKIILYKICTYVVCMYCNGLPSIYI